MNGHTSEELITGIAHVNLLVPSGTLDLANAFYGDTLGLRPRTVPSLQKGTLAWYVAQSMFDLRYTAALTTAGLTLATRDSKCTSLLDQTN